MCVCVCACVRARRCVRRARGYRIESFMSCGKERVCRVEIRVLLPVPCCTDLEPEGDGALAPCNVDDSLDFVR